MKILMYLKNNEAGKLVFVPVVEFDETRHDKETGRKLTDKQLEKADQKDIEIRRKLVTNTDVWKENPAARFQINLESEADAKGYKLGDKIEVTIKKV
jgi:hypothetical protein